MYPTLRSYINRALADVEIMARPRVDALDALARFVANQRHGDQPVKLTFICTHNSRRSHLAQIWAATAAARFGISDVQTYSGGTAATAFDARAVAAVERAGFQVDSPGGRNPHYRVTYSEDGPVLECFSKVFDHPANPSGGFAAVMTCSDADAACPFVPGAAFRARVTYEDPKAADGTPEEASVYDARCHQIATEMLYLFSRVC